MPIIQTQISAGKQPSGTKTITNNGIVDVTDYANADVQVPTTAPTSFITLTKSNDMLIRDRSVPFLNLDNATSIGEYVLRWGYSYNKSITNLDLSSLVKLDQQYCCDHAFYYSKVKTVDLSNIKEISGYCSATNMFANCSELETVDLSSLEVLGNTGGREDCSYMFSYCTKLDNVDLSNLKFVLGQTSSSYYAVSYMFNNCTSLTNINLSNLISSRPLQYMFYNCTNLTGSINFEKLATVYPTTGSIFYYTFANTGITSISFPSLLFNSNYNSNIFNNMLNGVSNCKVYFPSDWQSAQSWQSFTNGFGGTNTQIYFTLPSATDLNLSQVTEISAGAFQYSFQNCNTLTNIILSNNIKINNNAFNGAFKNCISLTNLDLSSLKDLTEGHYAFQNAFENCTGITDVDLSNLEILAGNYTFSNTFKGCTSLTNIDISSLTTIYSVYNSSTQWYTCTNMFNGCTNLQIITFDSLKNVFADYNSYPSFYQMFTGCISLTDIYFPALQSIGRSLSSILYDCTGVTLHFPSNMQSIISSISGYPDFGGTNTVVLFDLPKSNNILIGNNTNQYERNPKYDTLTALAWRIKDTGDTYKPIIDFTPFYTSGITDPVVGDTLYSDSACTTAITTIDSIA